MSKFKVGDIVTPTTDWLKGLDRGKKYKIEDIADPRIRVEGTSLYYDYSVFKIAEPEFKNGDEVEVSEGGNHWNKAKYLTYNKRGIRPHVVVAEGFSESSNWPFCRDRKKEYADALGVPVYEFRIKDE